jgi:hypothetical protein
MAIKPWDQQTTKEKLDTLRKALVHLAGSGDSVEAGEPSLICHRFAPKRMHVFRARVENPEAMPRVLST